MVVLRPVDFFCGYTGNQRHTIGINQTREGKRIIILLERLGMKECNTAPTPAYGKVLDNVMPTWR